MKNLILILLLSIAFLGISCSKKTSDTKKKDGVKKLNQKSSLLNNSKAHCESAVNNVMKIMLNNPEMKKMPKEELENRKKSLEEQKLKRIKKCIDDYNKDAVDCVNTASKMSDLHNCNTILNKSKKINKNLKVNNTGDKKSDCIKAVEHTIKLTMQDPKTRENYKGKLDKLKEAYAKQKASTIERCIKKYNKKSIDCELKAKTLVELEKCE